MWNEPLEFCNPVFIVRGPTKGWKRKEIGDFMKACVIMHNMIVEDERDNGQQDNNYEAMGEKIRVSRTHAEELSAFLQMHQQIEDKANHSQLQADLVEHLWQKSGDE